MKIFSNRSFSKSLFQSLRPKSNINYLKNGQLSAKPIIKSDNHLNNYCLYSNPNILKNNLMSFKTYQSFLIRTTHRRQYSTAMTVLILGQIGPIVGIIVGRVLHNWLKNMSQNKRKAFNELVSKNRWKFILFFSAFIALIYSFYRNYCEKTPFTKRKRFVLFSKKDYELISDYLFKILYNRHRHQILPTNHRTSRRVVKIVSRLIESNQEFEEIQDKRWSVFVIKDSSIANAFVLQTGQIFVLTGIIDLCDNDSQLGSILAHELSHVFLGHGNEMLTQEVLSNIIQTILTTILWTRFRAIKALITTLMTGFLIKKYSVLPSKRFIEIEADFVGLYMSAKTCYDVRESSAFWRKMAALETEDKKIKFSTHPSNTSRYQYLDSYMDEMIELMRYSNCPQLPETDPRKEVNEQYCESIKEELTQKKLDKMLIKSKRRE